MALRAPAVTCVRAVDDVWERERSRVRPSSSSESRSWFSVGFPGPLGALGTRRAEEVIRARSHQRAQRVGTAPASGVSRVEPGVDPAAARTAVECRAFGGP